MNIQENERNIQEIWGLFRETDRYQPLNILRRIIHKLFISLQFFAFYYKQ